MAEHGVGHQTNIMATVQDQMHCLQYLWLRWWLRGRGAGLLRGRRQRRGPRLLGHVHGEHVRAEGGTTVAAARLLRRSPLALRS